MPCASANVSGLSSSKCAHHSSGSSIVQHQPVPAPVLVLYTCSCRLHGGFSVVMLPVVHCSRFLTPCPLPRAQTCLLCCTPTQPPPTTLPSATPTHPTHADLQAHHALPVCPWRRGDSHQPTPALLRRPATHLALCVPPPRPFQHVCLQRTLFRGPPCSIPHLKHHHQPCPFHPGQSGGPHTAGRACEAAKPSMQPALD